MSEHTIQAGDFVSDIEIIVTLRSSVVELSDLLTLQRLISDTSHKYHESIQLTEIEQTVKSNSDRRLRIVKFVMHSS